LRTGGITLVLNPVDLTSTCAVGNELYTLNWIEALEIMIMPVENHFHAVTGGHWQKEILQKKLPT